MITQLVIADDHPLFRTALRDTVGRLLPEAEVAEAEDMASLERVMAKHADAELVLLDLHMPGAHGFSSLIFLRAQYPGTAVIVVSGLEGGAITQRAMSFGAAGFIHKSAAPERIGEAIRTVLDGGLSFPSDDAGVDEGDDDADLAQRLSSLTPQQFRVLMMVSDGLLNKQIAYELNVSEATVKAHVTAILRKLGLYSRTQAAVIAERLHVAAPRLSGDGAASSAAAVP